MPVHVAILEPYYGGSHRVFADTFAAHSRHQVSVATMPARKWKWRMRGAAMWFARQETAWMYGREGGPVDLILCNDMLSVSDLRAMLPAELRNVPVVCYFHENQLTYPLAPDDTVDYQYGMTNITSCLASDQVLFNSQHHLSAFLIATEWLLRQMPDCVPDDIIPAIVARSGVAYPPIDVKAPDETWNTQKAMGRAPRILWSHRWEYDKNPGPFFEALSVLAEEGVAFELVCVGEQFRTAPPEFAESTRRLESRLVHSGYVPSRDDYLALLRSCDVVVSTAIQENFGIAVLEAVASGCQPVLPDRLAYPEVIPLAYHPQCLYAKDETLLEHLRAVLTGPRMLSVQARLDLAAVVTRRFGTVAAISRLDEALAAASGQATA